MMKERYIPKNLNYPYPLDTASHYIKIKKDRGIIFDSNYPYVDKSKSFKRKQGWVYFLLRCLVFHLTGIKMGLKIKGKENLKGLDDGFVSVSNHIHFWDYIAYMKAINPRRSHVLVWDKNVNDKDGKLVRLVGGIPIPKDKGYKEFLKDVEEFLKDKGILHIYAEGSMWEYYPYIRPFKSGFATLAKKSGKNILPMAFSYRKPSFIRKYILKQPAAVTLTIGKVIETKDLSKDEILRKTFKSICNLSGNDFNPYDYLYNDSKRIDGILNED